MKKIAHIALFILFYSVITHAQKEINCDLIIENDNQYITNYNASPGDTLCLMAGFREHLYLRDIQGAQDTPVVLINYQGVVHIESYTNYGIRFANSRYVRITGAGSNEEYGIQIDTVSVGDGIDINFMSSDFEIDHLKIQNVKYSGIRVKTDPDCTFEAVRDSFTLYNVFLHHNYLRNIGTEGFYIGSSFFLGHRISACDTTVLPHIIDGVKIYQNKLESIGWDGIQVGCALNSCEIYDNEILNDSQEEFYNQMSGIMVNPGSRCHIYNNKILDGKGTGIINQGAGGQKIFNNLIINAGKDYYPDDQLQRQQFGIFSKYQYIHPEDSSYYIFNNTIINPKSDGIRYFNQNSKENLICNNLIINPGAFDYYENNGSLNNEGLDAYIHNYLDESDLILKNNLFDRNSSLQYFEDTINNNYHLSWQSPAFNSAYDVSEFEVDFDLDRNIRPFDRIYDIGAYELQSAQEVSDFYDLGIQLIPNPVKDEFRLDFGDQIFTDIRVKIISICGVVYFERKLKMDSNFFKNMSIKNLPKGMYLLELELDDQIHIQRFIKL